MCPVAQKRESSGTMYRRNGHRLSELVHRQKIQARSDVISLRKRALVIGQRGRRRTGTACAQSATPSRLAKGHGLERAGWLRVRWARQRQAWHLRCSPRSGLPVPGIGVERVLLELRVRRWDALERRPLRAGAGAMRTSWADGVPVLSCPRLPSSSISCLPLCYFSPFLAGSTPSAFAQHVGSWNGRRPDWEGRLLWEWAGSERESV